MYIHGPGAGTGFFLAKAEACHEIPTLCFLIEVHKIACRPGKFKITGNKPGSFVLELDEYLVKFLYLLCIPFGLYGDVVVGDNGKDLYLPAELA